MFLVIDCCLPFRTLTGIFYDIAIYTCQYAELVRQKRQPCQQITNGRFRTLVQIDVFLFGYFPDGTGVVTAMSGIDDYYEIFPP